MMQPTRRPSQSLGWVTWSSIGLGAQGFGRFLLLAVLARYLSAAEFGVVAATLIVIEIARVVHASIGPALVQRQDLRDEHVRAAFALALWSAVGIVAAIWLLAPLLAGFFRIDDLVVVMRAMSLMFVCQTVGLVPEALLQRTMQMRPLARAELVGVVVGFLPLGIGGALLGLGIWSLVAAHVGQALLKSLVLAVARPFPIALVPRWEPSRDLIRFSGGFVAAGLCNAVASQADNFVVGRWMSASALGIYSRAYQLMAMPAMFLGEVVDRVVFPLLARVQDDQPRLREAYCRGVSLVAVVMLPASAAAIVLAPELVRVVLGPNWDEVIPPFQVLMGGLVFRTGYKISDMLARATGTVYARAWRQAIFAVLIFAGALLGMAAGVTGIASGILVALAGNYLMMAGLSMRTTGLGWARYLALHVRGLVTALATGALALAAAAGLRQWTEQPWLVLGGTTLAVGAVLAAAVALAPRRILGGDGIWLFETLTGRARA